MKKLLIMLAVIATMVSCKTKQEVVTPTVVEEALTTRSENRGQGRNGGERNRPGRQSLDPEQVISQLNLTEEQETAYLKFEEDNKAKMAEVRANAGGDRTGMREQMMKLREERETALAGIFSAEQLAKYNQMLQAVRRPRKN